MTVKEGSLEAPTRHPLDWKNPEFYEVLSGIEPGEQVITSSYENFGDNEVLEF